MKGEFKDDHKDHHHHPHHHFHHLHQQPPPPPPPFAATHHHFQLNNTTSEEADSRRTTTPATTTTTTTPHDGASIEVVRRPRGRPPGSKNKPKPPVIITREPDPAMSPYVLEFSGGSDIVAAVNDFCRKRNTGLCVLSGSGAVSNVSLRQPTASAASAVTVLTFHGHFDILSISAAVLPAFPPFSNGFTISLAGPQGQTVGGAVAGPLIAAGTVYVVAASFNNPLYHRLPLEDEEHVRVSEGGSVAGASEQSPPGGSGHGLPSTVAESMSMYTCHLPSDVIWAPTPSRQVPPQPPLF